MPSSILPVHAVRPFSDETLGNFSWRQEAKLWPLSMHSYDSFVTSSGVNRVKIVYIREPLKTCFCLLVRMKSAPQLAFRDAGYLEGKGEVFDVKATTGER